MPLSRHFTLSELTHSATATAHRIDNQPDAAALACLQALATQVLDPLRDAVGRAISVTSGYRGPALNRLIGGAAKSQHQEGKAADIQSPGLPTLALFQTVIERQLPFDQVIYEVKSANTKWVHVSFDGAAGRRQILVASFAANGRASYKQISAEQALAMREPATRSAVALRYEEVADEPATAPAKKAVRSAVKTSAKTIAKSGTKTAAKTGAKIAAKRAAPRAQPAAEAPPAPVAARPAKRRAPRAAG